MWKTRIDLTGQRFGSLIVKAYADSNSGGDAVWGCLCDCGQETYSTKGNLQKSGTHKGCPLTIMDYTGQKIGKLTVLNREIDATSYDGHPVIQWKCICECGQEVIRKSRYLKRGNCMCKDCKGLHDKSKFGFMEIHQHHWYIIQRYASKRGFEFAITIEYAWNLYELQDRKCALSGIPIVFARSRKDHQVGKTTASLDRIDSSLGYVEGNVQWLHKWVNMMKSDFTQNEFIDYCRKIVEHNET